MRVHAAVREVGQSFHWQMPVCDGAYATSESQTGEVTQVIGWQRGFDDNAVMLDPAMLNHKSVIKYCKIVLIRWFESGKKLKLEER